MKKLLLPVVAVFALAFSGRAADVSVQLTDVHLCCQSCLKGVQAVAAKVSGLTAVADQDEGSIKLTAADEATLQKGVDALVGAGFFGKSSDPKIKVNAETGAKDRKVTELKVEGVHLCCGKCVKAVNGVLEGVPGVKANTAAKEAKSFTVSGDFNEKEVFEALQKAGLTGKVGK